MQRPKESLADLTGGQEFGKKSFSYTAHVRSVHHIVLENQSNLIWHSFQWLLACSTKWKYNMILIPAAPREVFCCYQPDTHHYCRTVDRKHHWFTWVQSKFLSNQDTTFLSKLEQIKKLQALQKQYYMIILWTSTTSAWEAHFMFTHKQGRWGLLWLQLQFYVSLCGSISSTEAPWYWSRCVR